MNKIYNVNNKHYTILNDKSILELETEKRIFMNDLNHIDSEFIEMLINEIKKRG